MTDSAMLKTAAIGKLMDIQELCNRLIDPEEFADPNQKSVALKVLDIIKAK